jgi:hypothetical protein
MNRNYPLTGWIVSEIFKLSFLKKVSLISFMERIPLIPPDVKTDRRNNRTANGNDYIFKPSSFYLHVHYFYHRIC